MYLQRMVPKHEAAAGSLEAGRLALKLDGTGYPSAKPTSVFLF